MYHFNVDIVNLGFREQLSDEGEIELLVFALVLFSMAFACAAPVEDALFLTDIFILSC